MLSDVHRAYLHDHAITDTVIDQQGLYSDSDHIVFPWRDSDTVTEQRRPWPEPENYDGPKYLWPKDTPLHLNIIRDNGPTSPVLVVEGTKQALAAASHADSRWSIYGMAGKDGWRKLDLARFRDREIVLAFDADAANNRDVYDSAHLLGEKLKRYGGTPRYLRFPGTGKDGLDDYLAAAAEADRGDLLAYEIEHAGGKPAPKVPPKRPRDDGPPDLNGRVGVAVNLDRKDVHDKIIGTLKTRHDGKTLFNYGDAIARVTGPGEVQALDRDTFTRYLLNDIACFRYTPATEKRAAVYEPTWPDANSIGAALSAADEFAPLDRVTRAPYIRTDGTVHLQPGYDHDERTLYVGDGGEPVDVPLTPSQAETQAAAQLLMDEWLGDFPFKEPADRANALALVLTPFIRGLVPLTPLAVVSGLHMNVGKNLLADVMHLLATGAPCNPLPYVNNEEEMRKQITSTFASGADLFVFDEAHTVEGAQLARAVTSLTYTDRILGATRMAKFPNNVTMLALGNQVQVNGDMARRVYFVKLHPAGGGTYGGETRSYRHPDLKEWTTANRAALLGAALTVIRGWFAAGAPTFTRGATLGSFEGWDRMMSGICAYAGFPEFLTDAKARRSESDFTTAYWEAHLAWGREQFGGEPFTTSEARSMAMAAPAEYEGPPDLEDPKGEGYSRRLGQAYARKDFTLQYKVLLWLRFVLWHNNVSKWQICIENGGKGGTGGATIPSRSGTAFSEAGNHVVTTDTHMHVPYIEASSLPPVPPQPPADMTSSSAKTTIESKGAPHTPTFESKEHPTMGPHESMGAIPLDLETATADDLWRSGPDFVRLAGLGDAVLETATDAALEVNAALAEGATLTGHNVTGFDLPALARHQGLPLAMLRGRVLDTDLIARLADPPPSGKDGVAKRPKGYYGLDAVCERAGLPGKTDDLPALAKEFGGYDQIPPSDERYRSYLVGDLEASRALTQRWLEQGVIDDYARRESDIGLITGQMSLNGFRVDTPEVDRTLAAQAQRRGANLALLASRYGLPLTDAKGEAHAAPLATKAGKTAMEAALRRYGVPEAQIPRTPKSGDLQLSGDAAGALAERYPQLAEWARAVAEVTGERSVYQTAKTYTVTDPDGVDRVHPSIRPYQATGRWSVTRPGLTVLGKRQGRHVERRIFLPEDGQVVIAVDLDQVDARAVAGHSGDAAYMAIFQDPDRDLWTEVALSVFGDAAHRDNAKAVGHGWNYGESINGLVRGGVSEEVARRFDAGMRRQYPQLVEWQRHVRSLGSAGELLDNGFGRKLRCDPRFAHTQAPALVGQATTRDLLAEGLLRLPVEIWPMLRVIVHDELVLSVPEKDWQDIAGVVQEAFRQDFRGVPITAGVSRPGRTWAQVYGD